MANSVTQLKNAYTECVYRFVNDTAGTPATFTISLPTLARVDQTIPGGVSPVVKISDLSFNVESGSNFKISRNSVLQYYLTGTGEHQAAYSSDGQNGTSDIVVVMGAGTLVMRILKGPEFKVNNLG